MTLQEVEQGITAGRGCFDLAVKLLAGSVRVIVTMRAPMLEKWSMSIVLVRNGHIDGLD